MAKVSEQDRKIFTDLYSLYARWHDKPLNLEAFTALADDVAAQVESNDQSKLAIELFLGVYAYFGWKYKKEDKSNVQ